MSVSGMRGEISSSPQTPSAVSFFHHLYSYIYCSTILMFWFWTFKLSVFRFFYKCILKPYEALWPVLHPIMHLSISVSWSSPHRLLLFRPCVHLLQIEQELVVLLLQPWCGVWADKCFGQWLNDPTIYFYLCRIFCSELTELISCYFFDSAVFIITELR